MKWYYRPWIVVLLIFLALGPFGLPLVYKSPAFNKTWKIILTFLTLVYTIYLCVVTFQITYGVVSPFLSYETVPGTM